MAIGRSKRSTGVGTVLTGRKEATSGFDEWGLEEEVREVGGGGAQGHAPIARWSGRRGRRAGARQMEAEPGSGHGWRCWVGQWWSCMAAAGRLWAVEGRR